MRPDLTPEQLSELRAMNDSIEIKRIRDAIKQGGSVTKRGWEPQGAERASWSWLGRVPDPQGDFEQWRLTDHARALVRELDFALEHGRCEG